MPHTQLTENAPAVLFGELAQWLFSLPHVEERRSRVSVPSSRAAWISDDIALASPLAEREFTHLHQEPGPGSQHLALAPAEAGIVLAQGWGEPHPIDGLKTGVRYLMIFAPRDAAELEVIKTIIGRAYDWTVPRATSTAESGTADVATTADAVPQPGSAEST